jgi:hypothetical protein
MRNEVPVPKRAVQRQDQMFLSLDPADRATTLRTAPSEARDTEQMPHGSGRPQLRAFGIVNPWHSHWEMRFRFARAVPFMPRTTFNVGLIGGERQELDSLRVLDGSRYSLGIPR